MAIYSIVTLYNLLNSCQRMALSFKKNIHLKIQMEHGQNNHARQPTIDIPVVIAIKPEVLKG